MEVLMLRAPKAAALLMGGSFQRCSGLFGAGPAPAWSAFSMAAALLQEWESARRSCV